ncbi:pyrroline-5-carboxylate reductase [Bacteriovorax sp. Seq25_V]|uniref:pyrroline-5-carboxylate reductase family protein n=1 Tax=Bacteriovorax sp. Seq25_V TaxID=1201288 RepID=UPI00038A0B9E|nr:pyrroline-5-carboxylate reductase [Bacteriovorax sp. Seq25_V]EQC48051.1 putative pyrroline-5-carboxylate reductase [Bacteriovorax sp. Seq25_V]
MKILILGAGNMVEAFFGRSVESFTSDEISITSPSNTSSRDFAKNYGINFINFENAFDVEYDAYILGMKPQVLLEQAKFFGEKIPKGKLIISILAGVDVNKLQGIFSTSQVIRLMPNTPSAVSMGVCPVYATSSTDELFLDYFAKSLQNTGLIFFVDNEDKLDKITPYSGSGPAYFFEIARIYTEKLISEGIPADLAREAIAMTMKGSAELILQSNKSLDTLRDNVTSKKGVTYEALAEMKENKLELILNSAIDRAHRRVTELKKGS